VLLLAEVILPAIVIKPVKGWTGTAYIRASGSVDPSDAPIQRNGTLYTLIGNISSSSDGIVVEKNDVTLNGAGYELSGAGISGSNGVNLSTRNNVTIMNLNVRNYGQGVYLHISSNNVVSWNNITGNKQYGIRLEDSSRNNTILRNSMRDNYIGLHLYLSSNNNISQNTFISGGVFVYSSFDNTLQENTVDGKPLVYLENVSNQTVTNAGQAILVRCHNILLENLTASDSALGVELWETNNSKIKNTTVSGMYTGIGLYNSHSNTIESNEITGNYYGIGLFLGSSNNSVYHNNLISNTVQAADFGSKNIWDDGYPTGGNYWSGYVGADQKCGPDQNSLGSDGIGDSKQLIETNSSDRYPLFTMWKALAGHDLSVVSVVSAKTVIGQSYGLNISLYVHNHGLYDETFNASIYANEIRIGLRAISLKSSEFATVEVVWNTSDYVLGNFTIGGLVDVVSGENNTANNLFTGGWVIIAKPGDVTGPNGWPDGKCDIRDVSFVSRLFGIFYPDQKYNPNMDVIYDLKIDIKDISSIAKLFGKYQ
jgi:parallel beta-helix repeat protein